MRTKIYIYCNNNKSSIEVKNALAQELLANDFYLMDKYSEETDILVCIGGDGTFLSFIHDCNFPSKPVIGINTGHLGFFQEALPNDIPDIVKILKNGKYKFHEIKPVKANVITKDKTIRLTGLNEILVRGENAHTTHLSIFIEKIKIQDFSGDGMLVSTPAGSTAYNYSLGGSLVSPDLDVLQITPIAPMNTSAYRSFHSSIILPTDNIIKIVPKERTKNSNIYIYYDGITKVFPDIKSIEITQSTDVIRVIRFDNYDYWQKLTSKLL